MTTTAPQTALSPTFPLTGLSVASAGVAVVFVARLLMPPFPAYGVPEARGPMFVAVAAFAAITVLAVIGALVVRRVARAGDAIRAGIVANRFTAACLVAFGAAFIVAPNRYQPQAGVVMNLAGLWLVGVGAWLGYASQDRRVQS